LRICPVSGDLSILIGVRIIGVVIRTHRRPLPCPTTNSKSIIAVCISIHIRPQQLHSTTVRPAMNPTHFVAQHLPARDGYTWTLPSRLGAMLAEVESIFGERDMSYTVLGIEFGPEVPMLWYPGNRKHIVIQLAKNAVNDTELALYQLAHECVHLLAPTGGEAAPVLEEGLATVFSEDYIAREFSRKGITNLPSYVQAAALTRQLLAHDPQAIHKLRALEPCFSRLTPAHFESALCEVDCSLIQQLLTRFDRAGV